MSHHEEESTFRTYTAAQASSYATERGDSSAGLYDFIISYHNSTSGSTSTDVLVDVGCGHGNGTRGLARHFSSAWGVDPSPQMIEIARELGGQSANGEAVKFVVGKAEKLDAVDEALNGKVDLLTAAMAAHWFDMPQFWHAAAKILKKGGTVVLWTGSSLYCHPTDTPNAKEVQGILTWLEEDVLVAYSTLGNEISRGYYDRLGMPWDARVEEFRKEDSERKYWDRDGKLSGEEFLLGRGAVSLDELANWLGTASMVTKWREAHPELVGTSDDVVVQAIERIKRAVGEGVKIKFGAGVALFGTRQV